MSSSSFSSSSSSSSSSAAAEADNANFKVGQKFPSPSPGQGDRVFYESLWREKGEKSPMALRWVVEHGILAPRAHDEAYKLYLKAAK